MRCGAVGECHIVARLAWLILILSAMMNGRMLATGSADDNGDVADAEVTARMFNTSRILEMSMQVGIAAVDWPGLGRAAI